MLLSAQQKVTRFCELTLEGAGVNTKVVAKLNFGEARKLIDRKGLIKDSSGKTVRFAAPVEVLNFMSDKGWQLVTSIADPKEAIIIFYFKKEMDASDLPNYNPEKEFEEILH
ncbi:hypothetical protein CK934_26160 [Chitinophaga sp. MD30]|nr:hypothetical protein CK934_26160 [Chitinophaga sp. MD30]